MYAINSAHVRLVWDIVVTHSHSLYGLSDEAICLWILRKFNERIHLNHEEAGVIQQYICDRTHLIRDMASA